MTGTLGQGLSGRCGESLSPARPVSGGIIPEGRKEKGQFRDAVKSSGNQSTHISMIHRRKLLGVS